MYQGEGNAFRTFSSRMLWRNLPNLPYVTGCPGYNDRITLGLENFASFQHLLSAILYFENHLIGFEKW